MQMMPNNSWAHRVALDALARADVCEATDILFPPIISVFLSRSSFVCPMHMDNAAHPHRKMLQQSACRHGRFAVTVSDELQDGRSLVRLRVVGGIERRPRQLTTTAKVSSLSVGMAPTTA